MASERDDEQGIGGREVIDGDNAKEVSIRLGDGLPREGDVGRLGDAAVVGAEVDVASHCGRKTLYTLPPDATRSRALAAARTVGIEGGNSRSEPIGCGSQRTSAAGGIGGDGCGGC